MVEQYKINCYRFIDKDTKNKAVVYARKEEVALYIVSIWNELGVFHFVKKRIGYIKKYYTSVPPYELEQEQIDTLLKWKEQSLE